MASIDRHQYSEEIRKGAAKFVKDLNLDSKAGSYTPRKSLNGDNGLLKKVSSSLSSKLEYFQKLDKESVSASLPRRSSANLVNSPIQNGEKSAVAHFTHRVKEVEQNEGVNGLLQNPKQSHLLARISGESQPLAGDNTSERIKSRTLGAIANFALGDTAGLEKVVTPLSRLPGQNLNVGELSSNGVHQAQLAVVTNNSTTRQMVAGGRRVSCEREMTGESKMLYQPGSYPTCEAGNNPQIYENIETYISGNSKHSTNNCSRVPIVVSKHSKHSTFYPTVLIDLSILLPSCTARYPRVKC